MRLDAPVMRAIFEEAVVERGVIGAWDDVAVPVLVGIGERFQATQRFVEVEHLISRCVSEVLGAVPRPPVASPSWGPPVAFPPRVPPLGLPPPVPPVGSPRAGSPPRVLPVGVASVGSPSRVLPVGSPPRVLLAAADEEQHTLPLEALAAALAEVGVPSRLLGARVPPRALDDAVTRTGPAAVVLWSQMADTGDPAQLARLREHPHPPLLLAAGGPGWPATLPAGVAQLTTLTEAVELVRAAVA